MFSYKGVLFYKAQSSLSLASTNINKTNNLHSKLLAFPVGFEYKNEISDVVSNVKLIRTNIAKLVRKASETKDLLCKNDAEFASEYYQSALSNYSGKETLNDSDKSFVNYYSSKYDEYLFKYLDEMNSQGNLPEEYRETYNQLKLKLEIKEYEKELEVLDKDSKKYKTKLSELNKKQEELYDMYISQLECKDNLTTEEQEILKNLKDSKSLNAKQAELEKLKKNIPVNPGNPNGRMTEQQGKNYVAAKKKYDDYMAKINKLEDEIEGLQKNLGVYENKWYEDIGEAFVKTGCAWKTAFKTKDLDDFKSAVKQTGATGTVIYRSANSGILKIDELVGDGLLAAGGSIVAGATWLFHDTWSDNDVAGTVMDWTLDQVRRDRVGEANKGFYEKNPIGKWINKNSNLKYDSAGAKAIQNGTKLAVEIAIATAAEIGSFGAATPLVTAMFALEGAGDAAESYAQSVDRNNGESYNYGMALGSTVLGAFSGAMKGKMYGKIGANTFNILKDPSLIKTGVSLLKETGAKKILTNELKSTSFWFDFLTTGGQKAGEVVNEYHKTGDINWGKAFTSFAGELLYARFTDKLTANNVDDLINQKTVFQTMKDVSSTAKNLYSKAEDIYNITKQNIAENHYFRSLLKIYGDTIGYTFGKNLKKEIIRNMPSNLNKIEKTRYLYIELAKKVNYDPEWIVSNPKPYYKYFKETSFKNLKNDKIICKGWAQLYKELLDEAGIDGAVVKREIDKNTSKPESIGHFWVEIGVDSDMKVVADATNAYRNSIDLLNCKVGKKTNGFCLCKKDAILYGNDELFSLVDLNKERKYLSYLNNLDEKVGYDYQKSRDIILKDFGKADNNVIKNFDDKVKENVDILNNILTRDKDSLGSVEAYGFLKSNKNFVTGSIFTDKEIYPIVSFVDEANNNNIKYYLFSEKQGLLPINKTELKNMIMKGEARDIPGIGG